MSSSTEEFVFTYTGDRPGEEVRPKVTRVIVDDTVTSIRDFAFQGCSSLTSIELPSSVPSIGYAAFANCSSLTAIEIPSSVTIIGRSAFNGCSSLTAIEIPSSVTSIGDKAFDGCSSLTAIEIPSSVTSIGDDAFYGCSSLTAIEIPSSVTSMGEFAFWGCSSLTAMEIPSSITSIGYAAFAACSSLTAIVIPSSVTSIGYAAFAACSSLTAIEIPSSVTRIGDDAFEGCSSLAPFVYNGEGAILSCAPRVMIDATVAAIGKHAFYNCSLLTTIVLPSLVTSIGDSVFFGCSSLTTIVIPSSVTSIGDSAFRDCSSLSWMEIPSSITSIGDSTFRDCSSLTWMTIPSSVTSIGVAAFQGCTSLTSIGIPSSVKTIGNDAFLRCTSLELAATQYASKNVTDWLKIRFDDRPLHLVCHKADVSKEKISSTKTGYLFQRDGFNLTELHVLMSNPKVNLEMVEAFRYLEDLIMHTDINGRNALHYACYNPNTTVDIVKLLLKDPQKSLHWVVDNSSDLPCAVAIRQNRSRDIQLVLFELYPIEVSRLNSTKEDDRTRLVDLTNSYLDDLWKAAGTKMLNARRKHGWVHFVSTFEKGEGVDTCVKFIQEAPIDDVEFLAYCKDNHGRSVMDNATSKIRKALEERILFMGRFELVQGPPIHKSATSVVLKAFDKEAVNEYGVQFDRYVNERPCLTNYIDKEGLKQVLLILGFGAEDERFNSHFAEWDTKRDGRILRDEFVGICKTVINNDRQGGVVLKFMKNKEQFQREVDSRNIHTLDPKYIVGITESYSADDNSDFDSALESNKKRYAAAFEANSHFYVKDFSEYRYAIVMPCADRNLDAIYRSERPSANEIRAIAKYIADAIDHVHKKGVIHGDVKLLNAVRFGTRIRLVDFDASSSTIGEGSFAGAKFSSGMLPPEMIAELSFDEYGQYINYFGKHSSDAASWEKIEPKGVNGADTLFAVRTFRTKQKEKSIVQDNKPISTMCEEPVERDDLPYILVKATPAIDIWSFGALLYELHACEALFAVNRDDDLKDGATMKELYEWNDTQKNTKLDKIKDHSARELLKKVLSKKSSERYQTMEDLLTDGYFEPDPHVGLSLSQELRTKRKKLPQLKKLKELVSRATSAIDGTGEKVLREMQKMEEYMVSWLACLAKFELLEGYKPTEEDAKWIQEIAIFYHALVPLMRVVLTTKPAKRRRPVTVFVSHTGNEKEPYAAPLTNYLKENGVPEVFLDKGLSIGSKGDDEMMWAAVSCRYFWCVLSEEFVQKVYPMRELLVGYIRHIQESEGGGFSLLLDCVEMGAQPKGAWMEQIFQVEALKLYDADGNHHDFPAGMQPAKTLESFDDRYKRIAASRMADGHVLVPGSASNADPEGNHGGVDQRRTDCYLMVQMSYF
jgi:serine/threonine protein kinase